MSSSRTWCEFGLKAIPQLYKVSWVNFASIDVKKRCLVPIEFATYSDKIWCDIVIMNIGHIILGRPWLYDLDVTIYGRLNFCLFVYDEKNVKLAPVRHVPPLDTRRPDASATRKH